MLVGIIVAMLCRSAASGAIRYVKTTAIGNCTSWAQACSLTTALNNPPSGDEIWVQAGTYSTASLVLANGVKLIGGFAGTETLASQSNPDSNVTILDGASAGPCVTNINTTVGAPSAMLRGFTLRNGRDDGSDEGGGLVLENSNALVVRCILEENSATHFGGAIVIRGKGSPQFINCIFRKNGKGATNPRDTKGGGAIFVRNGTPLFVNCLFENNQAGEGGVIHVMDGLASFINCTMASNQATDTYGGAIYDQSGRVTLKNCILWNNTTTRGVGSADAIMNGPGSTLATYSNIQGGWSTGSNNLNIDPLFVTPGTNYRLQNTSPCKDVGENTLPADTGDLDWDGNTIEQIPKDLGMLMRVRYGTVDMGAYELLLSGGGGGE
jgi:hypothetical protein